MQSVPRLGATCTPRHDRYAALDPHSASGVLRLSRATGSARLVLAVVVLGADARGDYTGHIRDVAVMAALSWDTAKRALRALRRLGELVTLTPGGPHGPSTWHLAAIRVPGAMPREGDAQ